MTEQDQNHFETQEHVDTESTNHSVYAPSSPSGYFGQAEATSDKSVYENQKDHAPESTEAQPSEERQNKPVLHQSNEENLRRLREKAKQAEKYERELEEYRKQLASLQQKTQAQSVYAPSSPSGYFGQAEATADREEDFNIADDDVAEGKHLRYFEKKVKALEKKLQEQQQQSTTSSAELRLKSQYPDIEKVVTSENLQTLKEVDPDLFMSLQYNPDVYSKGSLAYRQIKNLGIYKEDKYMKQKEQVNNNFNKPHPTNSVSPQQGESPLSHANAFANGLTPELKRKLYKEMVDASK